MNLPAYPRTKASGMVRLGDYVPENQLFAASRIRVNQNALASREDAKGGTMKLPAYPRAKPSGVDWLGDAPEHWELKPSLVNRLPPL